MATLSLAKKDWQRPTSSASTASGMSGVSSQDIEKMQTLFNDVQQMKKQLEASHQASANSRESSGGLSHYINESQDYRDKHRQSERQLNEARDTIVILTRKLNEAEDEIAGLHDYTKKQDTVTSMKATQINRMTTQYENLNLSQKEVIERSRESNIALIHELDEKTREIARLKGKSKDNIEKLSVVSVSHGQASQTIRRLEDEIESQKDEISTLRHELQEAKNTISDLRQVKKSEGLAMVEIEHLKGDVQRLVKMLRTTKEYQDFSDFADDNSGSIRFLSSHLRETAVDSRHKQLGTTNTGNSQKRACVQTSLLDEKSVWMPRDAHKFAKEFRTKHNGELNDELLELMLFELNKIWGRREHERVQRVKSQAAHECMKLKRQITQTADFTEVQAKNDINRLKGDLNRAYKANRDAFDNRSQKYPHGVHYVGETMRMSKDAHRVKRTMEKENEFLRSQIRAMSASKTRNDY